MKPSLALAQQPLESVFISKKRHQLGVNVSMVLLGALLIALAAQISIPLRPVSMTLLDMAAFFCAMAFGPRLAGLMIVSYYILGSLGAPIFENEQSGIKLLLGFNLGYYVGLVPSAMLTGYLVQHGWGRHIITSFLAAAIGMSIFMFFGAAAIAMHYGWWFAWTYGISPFIGINLLKIISLSVVIPQVWNAVGEKGEK
jgi:biotin transport system substrate-specific component